VRPLAGIVVLDFSTLLPGPLATLLLAEAGAEVIKIESPTGDGLRNWSPRCGDTSVQFAMLNRGKQSVRLDLRDPSTRHTLDALLSRADVLVEQFRPGVMQRLGLDFEALSPRYPGLIYCSITGYGQTGPKSGVAGHDLNYLAETGLLALSMGSAGNPVIPPALIADIGGGSYPAVINILLALRDRDRTGRGCHLDISMSDNLFTFMYSAIGTGRVTGTYPRNGQDTVTGGSARYHLYPTKDRRMVAVAALEDRFWNLFCELISLDPSLRVERADSTATKLAVGKIIAGETSQVWAGRFAGHDCCCSVVRDVAEALNDPHFVHRGVASEGPGAHDGRDVPALHVPIDDRFRPPIRHQ
jgi:crotonobetainyl-CoA:carnitine CoA-transferase CaiB-like acyl-CoA transferase